MLAWYSESPTWLAHTVSSLSKADVAHVVAVDGAYALYPGAHERPSSSVEQTEAIVETARGVGIGCTVHAPAHPWWGNEVEKRTFMFRAGNLVAEPFVDWFLCIDADEVVHKSPPDLLQRLSTSCHDVAGVTLCNTHDPHATEAKSMALRDVSWGTTEQQGLRVLLRALPSLRVEGTHAFYVGENEAGDTVHLRATSDLPSLAAAEPILDLKIEHRHEFRDLHRREQALAYYELRDRLNVERPVTAC